MKVKEFEKKGALVTGGGSGIGRATALAFAREGARVVIGNRNVQRGEETVSMIRNVGGTFSFQRTEGLGAAEIGALSVQRGEETVSMIRNVGGTSSFQRTDVLVAAEIEALVDHAVKTYGRLDFA